MPNTILKSFLNTPLTLLLTILIVLILYCVMQHKLYNLQSIVFDNEDEDNNNNDNEDNVNMNYMNHTNNINNINNTNNNSSKIQNYIIILKEIIEESKLNLKENFIPVTKEQLDKQIDDLLTLTGVINSFNTKSLPNIQEIIDSVNSQRIIKKNEFLKVLGNIYTLRYIDTINQQNAVSYKEYNKYLYPKENKYYKQYL